MLEVCNYSSADADTITTWISDENIAKMWSRNAFASYPILPQTLNDYYSRFEANEFIPLSFRDNNKLIGHLTITLDKQTCLAKLGFIIVDPLIRGKGYGKAIVSSALSIVFNTHKSKEATLYVYEKNTPACNCYFSLGFKPTSPSNDIICDFKNEKWRFIQLKITADDYCSSL